MCEITGYTEEELLATDFQSITHPDDLERGVEGLRRMLSGEIQYFYTEKRYIHKGGRTVWVLLSTSLVRDAEDRPLYFVVQIQDITEARRDKENLERLIRQNQSILASAGEGIYGLDLDERTSFVNPAAERMLGYGPGELAGRHQHDIVSHLNAEGVPYPEDECPVHAALRDGDVHSSSDEVFRRKDGTTFPVEYVSTPIREGGTVVGAVVTFRDITERKRGRGGAAQERGPLPPARREDERPRLPARARRALPLHQPLLPAPARLRARRPARHRPLRPLPSRGPRNVSAPRPTTRRSKGRPPSPSSTVSARSRGSTPGSRPSPSRYSTRAARSSGSRRPRATSARRKRVERVLAEAARAKAEFLAEVSHELRTPLTVIRGNAEIGLEFDRDCEHEELLREIVRESSTMSRMVEDLLFLARSESAAPPFRMEPVETSVLVKRPRTQGQISGRGTRRDPRYHARARPA